ncbi:hypothetical protein Tco_0976532 [Tanacetum coccineum]|uniref:Uncharacterized protein n=1 Tax=Tanacetum coccineum TaxID=301880 RepID=A0ABQ5EHJ6_9ASTR
METNKLVLPGTKLVLPGIKLVLLVNDEKQLHANVDSNAIVVTEASIRSSLFLNDADGTACLTNEAIFKNLALMGYEGELNKLTFQKALFSPQWKYLIHTILHCLSSESISWNEFSTNATSAVICLATNQKFNFSKLIFDGDQPYVTKSSSRPDNTHSPSINLEGTSGNEGDQVQLSNDNPHSGGNTSERAEDGLNLEELLSLCTNLSNRVLALETAKDAQAAKILKLNIRIKKLEKKCKPGKMSTKILLGCLDDLDVDLAKYGLIMDTEEAVTEGRQSKETEEQKGGSNEEPVNVAGNIGVSTAVNISTASRPEVSTATSMTPPTTTSVFKDKDIFLADALVMLSDKEKLKGVEIKEKKDAERPARSVLTFKPLPKIDPKDKGKGVLKEEPEPVKVKSKD